MKIKRQKEIEDKKVARDEFLRHQANSKLYKQQDIVKKARNIIDDQIQEKKEPPKHHPSKKFISSSSDSDEPEKINTN